MKKTTLITLSIVCVFLGSQATSKAISTLPTGWAVLSNLTIEDPATTVTGNMRSNTQIDFSGDYHVIGNVSAPVMNGEDATRITGTISIPGTPVVLPTLAEVLAAVGPYTTINGNVSAADAAALGAGTYYVIGNVTLGSLLPNHLTFVVQGTFDSAASTGLISFASGLAVYSTVSAGIGGNFVGEVIANNVDIHTGATITSIVPDGGATLTLLGLAMIGLTGLRRKLAA